MALVFRVISQNDEIKWSDNFMGKSPFTGVTVKFGDHRQALAVKYVLSFSSDIKRPRNQRFKRL